jgi:hypothetical protein
VVAEMNANPRINVNNVKERQMTNLKPFQPGNPGRPKGARARLGEKFLESVRADFEEHGDEVIRIVRTEDPSTYVTMIARLMPRELEARVAVEHAGPKGLEQHEWDLFRQVLDVLQAAGGDAERERTLDALEAFVRSELAAPVAIEAVPAPIVPKCPVPLPE